MPAAKEIGQWPLLLIYIKREGTFRGGMAAKPYVGGGVEEEGTLGLATLRDSVVEM
jgi:hypothetical protein